MVMPFSQPWSDDVFSKMFKPGIKDAQASRYAGVILSCGLVILSTKRLAEYYEGWPYSG